MRVLSLSPLVGSGWSTETFANGFIVSNCRVALVGIQLLEIALADDIASSALKDRDTWSYLGL